MRRAMLLVVVAAVLVPVVMPVPAAAASGADVLSVARVDSSGNLVSDGSVTPAPPAGGPVSAILSSDGQRSGRREP